VLVAQVDFDEKEKDDLYLIMVSALIHLVIQKHKKQKPNSHSLEMWSKLVLCVYLSSI